MYGKIRDFSRKPINAYFLNHTNTQNYKKFINAAFKYADTVCMTYNGSFREFSQSEWAFLKDSVTGHEITNHTSVPKGPTVCLIYLKTDDTVRSWLMERDNIYDFIYYDEWFDDLCFVKNGEVVFCSCTHEKFCHINKEWSENLEQTL